MPSCKCSKQCWLRFSKHYGLDLVLLLAIIVGTGMGVAIRKKDPPWTKRERIYLKFPGEMFLRAIKMTIIPLVVSSVITGVSSLNARSSGKIVGRTMLYYLCTTCVSVVVGVIMVLSIKPGLHQRPMNETSSQKLVSGVDSLLDLVRNMFPENIVTAAFEKAVTKLRVPSKSNKTISNGTHNITPTAVPPRYWYARVTTEREWNLLGLIGLSLAFGMAVSKSASNGRVVRQFFREINEAIFLIVNVILWFCPFGIVFLIAGKIVGIKNPGISISQLALYIATVSSGMAIHMFIVLPVAYFIFVRKNPFRFMLGMAEALLTAFSTGSSLVTLPATLHGVEEENKLDKRITRFVMPIGATINIDGTALYEAVAAIFIAQTNHISFGFGEILKVSLTAAAAAIGRAGVPEAGLVTMMVVLSAVGLPTKDVPLILSVDWFLDRLRTVISVWGDAVGAAIVQKFSEDDLLKTDYSTQDEPEQDDTEGCLEMAERSGSSDSHGSKKEIQTLV